MKNLYFSRNLKVDDAYIITVLGNEKSEKFSKRCQQSCDLVGQKYQIWPAYDGVSSAGIIAPKPLADDSLMSILKITDHYMTRGEVACALSHISLWLECAKLDRPIVILEHDAIMVKRFEEMESYNSIVYLGGTEWAEQNWPVLPIPPHAGEGPNYNFICRAHAYAIDPPMAKNLLAHVIKMGIVAPLDIMMRVDLFNVTHQGLYAYDKNADHQETTILGRPAVGRTTQRNDDLSR